MAEAQIPATGTELPASEGTIGTTNLSVDAAPHPLANLIPPELLSNLLAASKHKARSQETHEQIHLPTLLANKPIKLLLLGDSMFERFKTTGVNTPLGPSNAPYPDVFNAGVGGDRISNIIYRLGRPQGLLECLTGCGGAGYVFLEMGTNDLGDGKRPLREQDVESYKLVLETLRIVCGEKLRAIVVCGLNMKKRIKRDGVVEGSNEMLKKLVEEMKSEWQELGTVIDYLEADPEIIDHLEEDGVHLDEKGYEIFGARLWGRYGELRSRLEASVADGDLRH
ncbi:hypothetical protein H2198_004166 [Neophaeococcomyces mojaviensis]|uniref:Uncharacterized protein n=1 Tax=Neophaeococcomyces mojaviensis TaxID=3383035 RepID=A0ACC3A9A7_9EURO|nr:hypothetical protein H2198_004166 [Knufia sp. JES_112]